MISPSEPPGREPLLIAIVGPTASGKSALALATATALDGEVVNCDAMQIYRRVEIGTAKPSGEQRRMVPHHLYDIADPDEVYSAGRYMVEARRVCREIAGRGRRPIVVGGTGLYLKSLLEGVFSGPARSDELRRRLHRVADRKGPQLLHRWLQRRDPRSAARIQPLDRIRLVRALEVYLIAGAPISSLHSRREPLGGFTILKVGLRLPRADLYARINRRVEEMYRLGLIEEVRRLLEAGFSPESKVFEALGYRHAFGVLKGELSREAAIDLTCRDTRRYAKRQMTWFRRETDLHWVDSPGEDARAVAQLVALAETVCPPRQGPSTGSLPRCE
jgi:tRNA dimethylallyltransferase